jgi:hypothetical protein
MRPTKRGCPDDRDISQGVGRGHITERFDRHVERTIEGSLIRRNGSPNDPAFLIHSDNGGEVLKLRSEISAA